MEFIENKKTNKQYKGQDQKKTSLKYPAPNLHKRKQKKIIESSPEGFPPDKPSP